MRDYRKEDSGRSGVFAFDLRSGKLARRFRLGSSGAERTNLKHSSRQMFQAAQGLALSGDGKTLYVADYTDGLWALDLASKARRHLDGPPNVWLGGMDGLSRVAGGFITVHRRGEGAPDSRPEIPFNTQSTGPESQRVD
jgi:hypothetical protein